MLQKLRTGLGFRVAMAAAAFAALCFVAPPAVMAFGHGSNTVHCLANADTVDHGMHGGATHKDHGGPAKLPGDNSPSCCGLFCLSALAADACGTIAPAAIYSAPFPAREAHLFSRVPERPDRPPISHPVV
jgi:hypothetical protein